MEQPAENKGEPLKWTTVSEPGAAIKMKTASIPPLVQKSIERALEKGSSEAPPPSKGV